jgi:CubicO group peptidase (beta-lactamase class C family)
MLEWTKLPERTVLITEFREKTMKNHKRLRSMSIRIGLCFGLCLLVPGSGLTAVPSQEVDPAFRASIVEKIKAEVPKKLAEADVPGAAVAVVDGEKILWMETYGFTRRGGSEPVNQETLFSIQSMSKSFTALGVLMAVQDGLLDLDAPILKYLPDFTVNSRFEDFPERKMTLRHLLAHRAGFTHEAPVGGNFDDRPHSFKEHIVSISDTWLRYPVGYRYSYSNLGIDLAGYILQEAAGMPFWDCIQSKVLDPIGMSRSTMDVKKILESENRAIGHVAPGSDVADGIPVFIPMIPAGGVYTNIRDMAEYLRFHINLGEVGGRQLLERRLVDEMHAVAFPEKHERGGYGLCLARRIVGRTYFLQHGGGGYGFITSMCMFPELKLGFVTLTNSHQNRLTGGEIHDIIIEAVVENLWKTEPHPGEPSVTKERPVSLTDDRVTRLIGQYDSSVRIGSRDEEFGIFIGREFYPLQFYLDGEEIVGLFGNYSELRLKPPIWQGRGSLIHLNRFNGTCRFYDFHKPDKEGDKPGPDKPEWQKYVGRYRILAWGRQNAGFQSVRVRDGYLTINGQRCTEFLPGLFFTFNGEALDFRGTIPTFRNIMLIKQ